MMGIYKITNNVNGKCYIGQSIRVEDRLQEHRHNSSNEHLRNSISKYGLQNFTFEVIHEVDDRSVLDELEIEYIRQYHSTDPSRGYNVGYGGQAYRTDEDRARMSKIAKERAASPDYVNPMSDTILISKGDITSRCKKCDLHLYLEDGWVEGPSKLWRDKHRVGTQQEYFKTHKFIGPNNGFYGKHHTEETKQKIRESMPDTSYNWRGRHHTEESKRKMRGPRPSVSGENNPNYGKRKDKCAIYGRRIINNGNEEKKVKQDELSIYLERGWVLGRKPSMKAKMCDIGSKSCKGRIRVHRGDERRWIHPEDLQTYINNGYVKGW